MTERYLHYEEAGLYVVFCITDRQKLRLLHFSSKPYDFSRVIPEQFLEEGYAPVQCNVSGLDRPYERQGIMYTATEPGCAFLFDGVEDQSTPAGRCLLFSQHDPRTGLAVTTRWQFYAGLPAVRITNTITNSGSTPQTLEYLSSFSYLGLDKEGEGSFDRKLTVYIPHNGWQKELSWQKYSFAELGLAENQPFVNKRTSKTIDVTNTGNWSAKTFLPLGFVENRTADTGLFFQIEHNGSWHYEYGLQNSQVFLNVSGPTELQSHWFLTLSPGDSFSSVPVEAGVSKADFSDAMDVLTRVRRRMRRPNADNEKLPVIFNDYMNCLFGDPTTAKELPLIDAAAAVGCEYYVIDAGWYAPGEWWSGVGEWQESRERFPNGIREVTDYIRSRGMTPGVWLELEVMGIHCRKAAEVPDDWFFMRHGRRVYDRSRYQLDFRNPEVTAYVTGVVDRIVRDYGVGYIKMDYNIEPGIGTELHAESAGEGLLEHERAYLAWLDRIFLRYPDLVIENCSSGGCRMDYAMLSRYSIQSTSDQEDYANYAVISANAPSGVTPEQAAVWSYPQKDGEDEDVICNMVNALLLRVHQSGHLALLAPERLALV